MRLGIIIWTMLIMLVLFILFVSILGMNHLFDVEWFNEFNIRLVQYTQIIVPFLGRTHTFCLHHFI